MITHIGHGGSYLDGEGFFGSQIRLGFVGALLRHVSLNGVDAGLEIVRINQREIIGAVAYLE